MWIGYEKYICDFCNNEEDEENDPDSEIWECEKCGKNFCRKCFIKEYGETTFFNMLSEEDKIKCMDCYRLMEAAKSVQEFINGYGFSNFDVYDRTDEWLAIDVEGEDEDEVSSLLNRLHAWDLNASISDHYIEIYIGDDDRFQ